MCPIFFSLMCKFTTESGDFWNFFFDVITFLGCIGGCDTILKELIEICGTGSRMATGLTGLS